MYHILLYWICNCMHAAELKLHSIQAFISCFPIQQNVLLNNTCIGFLEFDLQPKVSFCEGSIAVQGAEIHPQASYLPQHSSQFTLQFPTSWQNKFFHVSDCQTISNRLFRSEPDTISVSWQCRSHLNILELKTMK